MFKIPFSILPGSWGLKGKTRARAEAEYLYSDKYTLKSNLLSIDLHFEDITQNEYDIAMVELQFEFNRISMDERDYALTDLNRGNISDQEYQTAILEIDLRTKKITQQEYNRKFATINRTSYIEVLETNFDPAKPEVGTFEFDWNDQFIEELRNAGYGIASSTDTDLVEEWFNRICINTAMEGGFFETPTPLSMRTASDTVTSDGKRVYS